MDELYHVYYQVLETNGEAFAHGLFAEAHDLLSTGLHCAFYLRSARKLATVEKLALEQLAQVQERFPALLWPLEPEEVSNYRTLAELATTYRALVEGTWQGSEPLVSSSCINGHRFEVTTTIDASLGTPFSLYTIDGVTVDPGVWDTESIIEQEHEDTHARALD